MISPLRTRRAAFWYLAHDRIVAAVLSRSEREPVLEACAASYSPPVAGAVFAAGVVELAWVLGCERFVHVAALASGFCRVEASPPEASRPRRRSRRHARHETLSPGDVALPGSLAVTVAREAAASPGAATEATDTERQRSERRGAVSGGHGVRVWADEGAVAQAASLFRRAQLRLIALDCEPCALASLADALGTSDADGARRQPLAAVSVLPESESAAEALGEDLAVPVGLAVAWFGGGRAV
jgi:hypothetical protein